MIKSKTKEVHCCDKCGKDEDYISSCDNCGAEYCWDHRKDNLISYPHSMYCSGSGDGSYCKKCVEKLTAAKDPRLLAYIAILDLRTEAEEAGKAFKKRVDAAEARIARYAKSRNNKLGNERA